MPVVLDAVADAWRMTVRSGMPLSSQPPSSIVQQDACGAAMELRELQARDEHCRWRYPIWIWNIVQRNSFHAKDVLGLLGRRAGIYLPCLSKSLLLSWKATVQESSLIGHEVRFNCDIRLAGR